MAWKVSGQSLELCSCKMLCPCWLGSEGEPDQGWCAGVFAFDIREGISDGVDLSGTKIALTGEWPANFFLGNCTLLVCVVEGGSAEQRSVLERDSSEERSGYLA